MQEELSTLFLHFFCLYPIEVSGKMDYNSAAYFKKKATINETQRH